MNRTRKLDGLLSSAFRARRLSQVSLGAKRRPVRWRRLSSRWVVVHRETQNKHKGVIVSGLYARTVFFVKDAESSLSFYTETLGFSLDWNYQEQGRAYVFQVSLLGFELILNQTDPSTVDRAGHGRLFIGLEDDQMDAFRKH